MSGRERVLGAAPQSGPARVRVVFVAAAAVLVGVVVPAAVLLLSADWPALALPPLAASALLLEYRRESRREQAAGRRAERAEAAALQDELTGCLNDAGLTRFGGHLLHGVRRRGEAMHAFVIDIDQLVEVERVLGRPAADEVVVAVADAVRSGVRGTDVVSRSGRGVLVVVGPGCGVHPAEMERRVHATAVQTPPVPMTVWPCRVTVGQAVLEPWDDGGLDDLLLRAYQDLQLRSALRAPSAPEPGLAASPDRP